VPTEKARVTLYTRRGCHLCEEAKAELLAAGDRDLYLLEEIDIDRDPALVARFGTEIPVVAIDGTIVFKYRLTAAEFRRQLRQSRSL
jgi:glutaredoxin